MARLSTAPVHSENVRIQLGLAGCVWSSVVRARGEIEDDGGGI